MVTEETHQEIAGKLFQCFKDKSQLPLLNVTYPDLDVEDSYRIQEYVVSSFLAEGRSIKGYKIGLTSKAMQAMA